MRYLPPWPSFFALRVELRVGLDGVFSASGWARFLFRASWGASESRQYMSRRRTRKQREHLWGHLSALGAYEMAS